MRCGLITQKKRARTQKISWSTIIVVPKHWEFDFFESVVYRAAGDLPIALLPPCTPRLLCHAEASRTKFDCRYSTYATEDWVSVRSQRHSTCRAHPSMQLSPSLFNTGLSLIDLELDVLRLLGPEFAYSSCDKSTRERFQPQLNWAKLCLTPTSSVSRSLPFADCWSMKAIAATWNKRDLNSSRDTRESARPLQETILTGVLRSGKMLFSLTSASFWSSIPLVATTVGRSQGRVYYGTKSLQQESLVAAPSWSGVAWHSKESGTWRKLRAGSMLPFIAISLGTNSQRRSSIIVWTGAKSFSSTIMIPNILQKSPKSGSGSIKFQYCRGHLVLRIWIRLNIYGAKSRGDSVFTPELRGRSRSFGRLCKRFGTAYLQASVKSSIGRCLTESLNYIASKVGIQAIESS